MINKIELIASVSPCIATKEMKKSFRNKNKRDSSGNRKKMVKTPLINLDEDSPGRE